MHALDRLYDMTAVLAYARGAVLYAGLHQALYALGDEAVSEVQLREFANMTATWLQVSDRWGGEDLNVPCPALPRACTLKAGSSAQH